MLNFLVSTFHVIYETLFEVIIGILVGFIVFYLLAYYFKIDIKNENQTRTIYDSLINSESSKLSENDKSLLLKLQPKDYKTPMELLSELVRRKTLQTKSEVYNSTKDSQEFQPNSQEYLSPILDPEKPGHLSTEIIYVLKALGGLELPESWTLDPKDVDIMSVDSGTVLLQPGEHLDTVFVVVTGELGVYTYMDMNRKSGEYNIKSIQPGEFFFSSTSIIECLLDCKSINKFLYLRASKTSRIAKYRIRSFYDNFALSPHSWVRTIQAVMTRLQHCTLLTCNGYLGIGEKCFEKNRILPDASKFQQFETMDSVDALNTGAIALAQAMGIPQEFELLRKKAKLLRCPRGTIIQEENTFKINITFVLSGQICLKKGSPDEQNSEGALKFNVFPGEMLPSMQLLTNEPTMLTATAVCPTIYLKLLRRDYIELLSNHPIIYLKLAHHALKFISRFARVFDLAVTWVRIDTGQELFREGDVSDCMYTVMSGRLRAVEPRKTLEEYGRFDVIGISDMADGRPRRSTVIAVRFSHLVCIPEKLLTFVKARYPQVATNLLQIITKCWQQPNPNPFSPAISIFDGSSPNFRTIAVVPASHLIPLNEFTCELYNCLSTHVKTLRLSSQVVIKHFEPSVIRRKLDLSLMRWLSIQEISYPFVIYQCDFSPSNWTRRCLRMADAILIVAMGELPMASQTLANTLLKCNEKGVLQSKELVLLWREETKFPTGTAEWINKSYYARFHHIRVHNRMFQWSATEAENLESKVVGYYEKNVFGETDQKSGFARLARILTGNAVGIVFGGGAARGAAHAGALRACLEKQIAIDMVGGTSIGALFGAIFATTPDFRACERMEEFFCDRVRNNVIDVLRDLTWAHTAILTGQRFNILVERVLGDVRFEDCWLSFFCVTTDITTSTMRVHRSGLMWPAIRGSMSIAGYVPPLCDPIDGHLLLDGAYVNNLPADIMRSFGASHVIAIDVGMAEDNSTLTNYGLKLSGFWVLFKKWWPFGDQIRVLSMNEVQNRLAYVCCVHQLESVKNAPWCCYVKLPIDAFPIFDFTKFTEASQVGYRHTCDYLDNILKSSTATPLQHRLLGCAKNIGKLAMLTTAAAASASGPKSGSREIIIPSPFNMSVVPLSGVAAYKGSETDQSPPNQKATNDSPTIQENV